MNSLQTTKTGSGPPGAPPWGILAGLFVTTVVAVGNGPAYGQVDTAAARQSRAVICRVLQARMVRVITGSKPSIPVRLPDVEHELCAAAVGLSAAPLEAAVNVNPATRCPFAVCGRTLSTTGSHCSERRAKEIVWIPAAELPTECRRNATLDLPVTEQTLFAARKHLEQCLNQVRATPGARLQGWHPAHVATVAQGVVAAPLETSLPLDELEKRRSAAASSAWNASDSTEASLALQVYIPLLRGYLARESKEERARGVGGNRRLLDATPGTATNVHRLAELIVARESRGEASRLTHRQFAATFPGPTSWSRWFRPDELEELLSGRIEERFPVNDIFGGSPQRRFRSHAR